MFLHHVALSSVQGAIKIYKTRKQKKKIICIKLEEKDEAYGVGSGGWGVTGTGWARSWGTAAKRKQLPQWPYLKLSLFLQRLHLGLIGLCRVTLRNTFPLHFLDDHDRLPLPKAAGRKHVRPHAISKIHDLQGGKKKTCLLPTDIHWFKWCAKVAYKFKCSLSSSQNQVPRLMAPKGELEQTWWVCKSHREVLSIALLSSYTAGKKSKPRHALHSNWEVQVYVTQSFKWMTGKWQRSGKCLRLKYLKCVGAQNTGAKLKGRRQRMYRSVDSFWLPLPFFFTG